MKYLNKISAGVILLAVAWALPAFAAGTQAKGKAASASPSIEPMAQSADTAPSAKAVSELLFGLGTEMRKGQTLGGLSFDLRFPVSLPYSLRPSLEVGFYFNFEQTFFDLPVTLGVIRPFAISGFLNGKSEVIAGLKVGQWFTSNSVEDGGLLLLGVLGWEAHLEGWTPFLQLQAGLLRGKLTAYPRFGLLFKI